MGAGSSAERLAAVALVGFGVALENVARSCYATFQGYERMEFAALCAIVQRVITSVVALVVLALGGGVVAVSLVYAGGAVVAFLLALWALRRYAVHVRWHVDPSRRREIVLQGVAIGIAIVLFTVLLALDSVLLGLLRDTGDVGVYGAAFRLVETTMFVSWSLGGAMLPWFARQQVLLAGRAFVRVVGAVELLRIASGPAAGALVMAGVLLLLDLPLAVSLVLGGLAYLAGLAPPSSWPPGATTLASCVPPSLPAGARP